MVMDAERLASLATSGAADVVELFSSIQGEGPRVGERHLFLRFVHCDIQCRYCDTPACHAVPAKARLEVAPDARRDEEQENPVPLSELAARISAHLDAVPHRALSFTGGEPLLQPHAIRELAPTARSRGVATLLETDGNLPEAFAEVAASIDILSLDWKLPSATGEPARYDEHRRILELGRDLEAWVKLVFIEETPEEEVVEAARSVAAIRPSLPFVLQPLTAFGRERRVPSPARVLELQRAASRLLADVRVIPQIHPQLNQP